MLKMFKKLFDNEYKELKRFMAIADEIEALSEEYENMSDEELAGMTNKLKSELKEGKTLDATFREEFKYVL